MNHLLLLDCFLLSIYFTFCYGILCNSGWTPAGGKCYKIITKPVSKVHKASCTYPTQITGNLTNSLGFSEKVWIKKNGSNFAIFLVNNTAAVNNGGYYSLCEEPQINASMELYKNVQFHEGNWLIPNSKLIIEEIKQFLKNSNSEMVWVGIISNGSYFWTDELKLTPNHKQLLGLQNITERERLCGVLSNNWNISFRNCSECHDGIGISNKEISTPNMRSNCLSTTTEEQSTHLTIIKSTDQTTQITMTKNLYPTPDHQTTQITMTKNLYPTPDHQTTQITMTKNLYPTPDHQTTQITMTKNPSLTPDHSKACVCVSNQTLTPEEFMESIKDIKVKVTDVSKYKRSKISAPDERTSSRAIGMVAVVVMVIPFSLIILSDIPVIIQPLITYWKQKKVSTNVIP